MHMQKILFAFLAVALVSCHSEEPKESVSKTAAAESLPYTATYSSKWEIGDSKNVETVLKAWKGWESGDLSSIRKIFADSMRFYLRDGGQLSGQTDTVFSQIQQYRNTLSSIKVSLNSCVSL